MTVPEAARQIGCSVRTVYALCAWRALGHRRVGLGRGKVVIDQADVDAYLDSTRVAATDVVPKAPRGKRLVVRDVLAEWRRGTRR